MNRDDCNRWMRRQVQEKVRRLVLSTVPSELRKGSEELLAFKIPSRPTDKWYKSSVKAVEDAVRRDMETLEQSTQAYSLIAYDKDENLTDRFPFREIDPNGAEDPVEPTNDGLMKQLMVHNKDLARTMSDMYKHGMDYYARTLGQLSESHSRLIEERLDTIKVVEALRSEEFDRRLTAKREEANDDMRAQLLSKLMALGPVLLAKLTGKNLPGEMSESDHLILSLVEGLDSDQLERLMTVLKPEQQVLILTLIDKLKQKEEQAKDVPRQPPKVEVVK